MKTYKGYEGKEIIEATDEEVEHVLKKGNAKDTIDLYMKLRMASHWQSNKLKGSIAIEQSNWLKEKVQRLLENAGWEAHIVNHLQADNALDYIHDTGSKLEVHEVPFANELNLTLEDDELFNNDGDLRNKNDSMKLLKVRIGEEEIDLDDECLSEDDKEIVDAIMEKEGLNYLHELDVDYKTLRSGGREFEWFFDEDDAEVKAREYLEEGELWKMAVEGDNTTAGLDDWIDDVLSTDGWGQTFGSYDGLERRCKTKSGECVPYIRTN